MVIRHSRQERETLVCKSCIRGDIARWVTLTQENRANYY